MLACDKGMCWDAGFTVPMLTSRSRSRSRSPRDVAWAEGMGWCCICLVCVRG